MEKALIIVGLGIAYLCWVTKRGGEYWDKKSPAIMKRKAEIKRKLEDNEKLTRMEFLDFYVTKVVYGSLKYGMYGGLVLSLAGVILFIFHPLIPDKPYHEYRPFKNTQVPIRDKQIHSYSTEYRGLRVGSSTLSDVVNVLGKRISKINNSNNVNYRFDKVDVTIQDATGRINTIIIYDEDYVDVNGYKIGTSYDVISKDLNVEGTQQALIERSNGIIYWFKNQRVSRIVYAAQL